jgi:hypothetical protein
MKYLSIILAVSGILGAAQAPQTLTGVITDTMCGVKHDMKAHSDADCVKLCTKGSAQYALVDGEKVWRLSDQKGSANFAAQRVKVLGTLDEKNKFIKVVSIAAVN